jgi:hypothetical protein
VTCPSRYRGLRVSLRFLPFTADRAVMIIPLDIAIWLAAGAVFFAFMVALAAD